MRAATNLPTYTHVESFKSKQIEVMQRSPKAGIQCAVADETIAIPTLHRPWPPIRLPVSEGLTRKVVFEIQSDLKVALGKAPQLVAGLSVPDGPVHALAGTGVDTDERPRTHAPAERGSPRRVVFPPSPSGMESPGRPRLVNDRRGITPVQPLGVVLRVVSPVRNDDLRSPPEFFHQGFEIVHIALVSERYDLCERDAIPGAYRDVGPVAKYPFPALWLLALCCLPGTTSGSLNSSRLRLELVLTIAESTGGRSN